MRSFEKYYSGPYIFDESDGWIIRTPGDGLYKK